MALVTINETVQQAYAFIADAVRIRKAAIILIKVAKMIVEVSIF